MAPGLPYANAAQVAYPDRQGVAFVGDGGSDAGCEFATAVKYRLPIKMMIIKNNVLGQIKWEQMVFFGNPEYGVELQPIDFAKFAEACGGVGFRWERPDEVRAAMEMAFRSTKPAVVEAVVDPFEPPMPGRARSSKRSISPSRSHGRAESRADRDNDLPRQGQQSSSSRPEWVSAHTSTKMNTRSATRRSPSSGSRRLGLQGADGRPRIGWDLRVAAYDPGPRRGHRGGGTNGPRLFIRGHVHGDTRPRPARRRDPRPGRPGHPGGMVGDGRSDPQPRPARHRVDGDRGGRHGALGPEGPVARVCRWWRHPRGPAASRSPSTAAADSPRILEQAASGPAWGLGRRGDPTREDKGRPRARVPMSTASSRPHAGR